MQWRRMATKRKRTRKMPFKPHVHDGPLMCIPVHAPTPQNVRSKLLYGVTTKRRSKEASCNGSTTKAIHVGSRQLRQNIMKQASLWINEKGGPRDVLQRFGTIAGRLLGSRCRYSEETLAPGCFGVVGANRHAHERAFMNTKRLKGIFPPPLQLPRHPSSVARVHRTTNVVRGAIFGHSLCAAVLTEKLYMFAEKIKKRRFLHHNCCKYNIKHFFNFQACKFSCWDIMYTYTEK